MDATDPQAYLISRDGGSSSTPPVRQTVAAARLLHQPPGASPTKLRGMAIKPCL